MSGLRDLVVVGAGVGGLTTAALAAHDGLDVLVLEAHARLGGCAGDFWKRGVLLPAGATLVSGFEPGGLHDQVYRRLGLTAQVVPVRPAMAVLLPDRTVDVSTTWPAWDAEWRRAFPGHERAKTRFWREVRALDDLAYRFATHHPALPPRKLDDLLRVAPALRPGALTRLWALWRTVRELAERTGAAADRAHGRFLDVQLLISMQCTSEVCVALNGALALSLYRHGCFYPAGGPGALGQDLRDALLAAGGQLRCHTAAVAVRREGAAWRIALDDGEAVLARQVVLNVSAWSLPELLGADCPAALRGRVRKLPVGWGAVMLHGIVEASEIADRAPFHCQVVADYEQPLAEGNSCFVSLMPAEGRADGRAVLSVSTHTDPRLWLVDSQEEYEERRARYCARLLDAAARALPGLGARLQYVDCATPRTFERFTSRPLGQVGGLPQTREWANFRALSHRTGLPGLYLVGDTVFPGAGTIGVTLSGVNAYRDVMQQAGAHLWPFARWPRRLQRARAAHTSAHAHADDAVQARRAA